MALLGVLVVSLGGDRSCRTGVIVATVNVRQKGGLRRSGLDPRESQALRAFGLLYRPAFKGDQIVVFDSSDADDNPQCGVV